MECSTALKVRIPAKFYMKIQYSSHQQRLGYDLYQKYLSFRQQLVKHVVVHLPNKIWFTLGLIVIIVIFLVAHVLAVTIMICSSDPKCLM